MTTEAETEAAMPQRRSWWSSLSLSSQIAVGIAAGAVLGLFLGEYATFLQMVADAYIKLLQMTVLPYVTIAIIAGLGSLDLAEARAIGVRVGWLLALVWSVALTAVLLFAVIFPPSQNASFFSTTLVEEREPFDFLNLYIPTNPFNSLANNIVPAVVLFSIIVGVALIGVPNKQPLLDVLGTAAKAVARATNFVVALTPYGTFAIAAVVAGTISVDEVERLEVYLIAYVGISLLLSLWVLPGLVATLTPVPYRALIARTRAALLMAFMTTSLFAVLPLLTEEAKALIRDFAPGDGAHDAATDVIVPASYNFPHTGKLLSLSFILFAGWFADVRIPLLDYPRLVGAGLLTMFGSVNAAIPFLLDLLRIPADTFRLFVTSSIVNARFGTLLAAVHTLVIAILGTCAVSGALRFDGRKILRFAAVTAMLTIGVVGGTRVFLQAAVQHSYDKDVTLLSMRPMRDRGAFRFYTDAAQASPIQAPSGSIIDRVHERHVLRVGYFDDSLPYVFVNRRNELVGFDVEMGLQLARDLGATAEFVRLDRSVLDHGLDATLCDLVMSGVAITSERSLQLQFSTAYLDETVAFVVPDRDLTKFSEWASVRERGHVRLAVPNAPYFIEKVRDELPNAEIVPVERVDEMFAPRNPPIDAVMMTAERGSAYTLLHPEFSVAVPKPRPFKVPLAYVIAGRDPTMTSMVNTWIELKRRDGTIDELFSHWILGQDVTPKPRRWSIGHNVFGWW